MLGIIDHFGKVCFHFCRATGVIILVLGLFVQLTGDTPVYIFYYIFGPILVAVGYLIKFILCHNKS